MNIKTLLLSVLAVSTLTACQTIDDLMSGLNPNIGAPESHLVREPTSNALINDCPQVKIVDELSMITEFPNPALPDPQMLISLASLKMEESSCTYSSRSVTMDINLRFESELGPRGKMNASDRPFVSYPFFVAITNEHGRILAKEVFAASMTYDANEERHTYREGIRQVIPLVDAQAAREHKVLIGFQLTADQLAYNRRLTSLTRPMRGQPVLIQRQEQQAQPEMMPGAPIPIMGSGY